MILVHTTFQGEAPPGMLLTISFNPTLTLLMPVTSWKKSYMYIYFFTLSPLLLEEQPKQVINNAKENQTKTSFQWSSP